MPKQSRLYLQINVHLNEGCFLLRPSAESPDAVLAAEFDASSSGVCLPLLVACMSASLCAFCTSCAR